MLGMLMDRTPDEWQAIGSIGTLITAVIGVVFAMYQLHDSRAIRREQSAPYVIVEMSASKFGYPHSDLVIRNIGSTPAFEVSITIDPVMERWEPVKDYPFMGARPLAAPIAMIAPGQEIRVYFDSAHRRNGKGLASVFHATVSGFDSHRRKLPVGSYALDVDAGEGILYADPHDIQWMGDRMDRIDKSLQTISASVDRWLTNTPQRAALDTPQRAALDNVR